MEQQFAERHLGLATSEIERALASLGYKDLEELLTKAVPTTILEGKSTEIGEALTEGQMTARLKQFAAANLPSKSMIGQGYYGCEMPAPVRRLILENPAWYTAYTPYQAEISQGRLEMLLNFQTMCTELTGLEEANASLLDEATAAAEAMTLLHRNYNSSDANKFLIDADLFGQVHSVLKTRAEPLGIELVVCASDEDFDPTASFGALIGYPSASGAIRDRSELVKKLSEANVKTAVCSDLLALCLLPPPSEMGAVIAVGSTQRFGVAMGCGGPHAAFMAFSSELKRQVPGRVVGISQDSEGRPALRLALQTREQHIRRAKATSNICTAQVLPAILAAAYAIYHGPVGLRRIAKRIHNLTRQLAGGLQAGGYPLAGDKFFDTIRVTTDKAAELVAAAAKAGFDLNLVDKTQSGISVDETTASADIAKLLEVFGVKETSESFGSLGVSRKQDCLTQPVFNRYHTEHELMRYLRKLASRDIALDRSMIPLGSCTMKLNAASEMEPISWPEFANVHPFSPPASQAGYAQLADELADMLAKLTGMDATSLQPNAGSQGEYAGLLAIRGYLAAKGQAHRNVCMIPESAHGTNPASAVAVGMEIVSIKIDSDGEVDLEDLKARCQEHADDLAALMITYPSIFGIYGPQIKQVCKIVHEAGGQVYLDGANLNAMVGVVRPGDLGADVMHINLHKTFCIPHGGGGPGMGPISCKEHLKQYLPAVEQQRGGIGSVSAAPLGSGLILIISWAYIKMMGGSGLRRATAIAILAANYMAERLKKCYQLAYQGETGMVAHEFIIDAREFKRVGVSVEDIAKRLIDMGFHAPTMSFPLAGAIMIEPTESESLTEIDRFCEALEKIREEIGQIETGKWPKDNNPLVNAPHPAEDLLSDNYDRPYTRTEAAYPLAWIRRDKYFPPVSRINQVLGDRKLITKLQPDEEFVI